MPLESATLRGHKKVMIKSAHGKFLPPQVTTLESTACISHTCHGSLLYMYIYTTQCRWSPWRRRRSEPAHVTSKVCYSEILILMTTTLDWTIQCFVELCRLTVALPVYEGGTHVQRWFAISSDSNVGDLLANSVLYGTKAATKYELCAFHSTLLSERPMQWKWLLVCRS